MIYEHLVKLPPSVKGFVREDAEGNQHIYYNAADARLETYEHELQHILSDEIHSDDVEELK